MKDLASYRPCPVCDSESAQACDAYSPPPWQVVTCTSCGMTYLRNPPSYEALEEDFAWEKTYTEKRAASGGSTVFSPLVRRLRKVLGQRDKTASFRRWFKDGDVLDIGAGWGSRIRPPMTPYGIELSTALQTEADKRMRATGGYCLHGPGATEIWKFDAAKFDGIVMFSYLEHETDVMGVLKGACRALKDTGAVFVRVPNFGSLNRQVIGSRWCGFRYPDHVNYFTLKTLRDAAARAGFSAQLVNRITLPVDDNVSVLLRKIAGAVA